MYKTRHIPKKYDKNFQYQKKKAQEEKKKEREEKKKAEQEAKAIAKSGKKGGLGAGGTGKAAKELESKTKAIKKQKTLVEKANMTLTNAKVVIKKDLDKQSTNKKDLGILPASQSTDEDTPMAPERSESS